MLDWDRMTSTYTALGYGFIPEENYFAAYKLSQPINSVDKLVLINQGLSSENKKQLTQFVLLSSSDTILDDWEPSSQTLYDYMMANLSTK